MFHVEHRYSSLSTDLILSMLPEEVHPANHPKHRSC